MLVINYYPPPPPPRECFVQSLVGPVVQRNFKRSHCIFAIFAIISLLVVLLYPFFSWINCVTFSENDSYNDFGVKEFLVSYIYVCYLSIIYLWRRNDPLLWFCLIQWYFMLSLIVIGQVVLESKTKIVFKIYRWMLDKKSDEKGSLQLSTFVS